MNDCMIDLETLGVDSDAVIVSLGAVLFDENGLGEKFYMNVDIQTALDNGHSINGSTIKWWLQQSEAARTALIMADLPLPTVLVNFSKWLSQHADDEYVRVWGNGATFDNVILSNAYKSCKLQKPWRYSSDRCYRTVCGQFGYLVEQPQREGVYHNALDDAKYQAEYLIQLHNNVTEGIIGTIK